MKSNLKNKSRSFNNDLSNRAKEVIKRLKKEYGVVECTLDERFDPWRLMVSAILAAQCTDARVNLVVPELFKRYPTMETFANSSPQEIEPYIASCGLFRSKAKSIYKAANYLLLNEGGQVPKNFDALIKIPGVGRKIANLILGDCFGVEAVVVDTHCLRLALLLQFSDSDNPVKVEKALCTYVEYGDWANWGHYMVEHGRKVCKARNPQCNLCVLSDICPSSIV